MKSPKRAFLYGFLLWLIPFAVAFVIFPLKESGSPLFETIMPVVVVSAAILFINLYFVGIDDRFLWDFILQVALLRLLPTWWKAVACPSLVVLPILVFELTNSGNLSGFIPLWVTP